MNENSGFYSRKTLDATKLGGEYIKVCKTTNPPTCKHGGVLFSTSSKNKRHGNANLSKKTKSVKEAGFGRRTWLVRRGQQERKEGKKWR